MKNKYLGETVTNISNTGYKDFTKEDWALLWIEMHSGIDGSHHKDWLIDQIVRILKNTPVTLKIANWEGGKSEERFGLGDPPVEYWQWVVYMKGAGGYDPGTYSYDFGIAP